MTEILKAPSPPVPGIHEMPEKIKRAPKDTYNPKEVMRRNYEELDFEAPYIDLMGRPEPKFIAMLYGPPGAGKSTFALRFAEYLANNFGKVYYNSHEERIKKTIRDRMVSIAFKTRDGRFQFGDAVPFNTLMDKIRKNHYRFVFIDSVQYMDFTIEQLQEMTKEFKKRLLSIIMISFGESWGKPTRASDHLFASDIKGFFYLNEKATYGMARFYGRYKPQIVNAEVFKVPQQTLKLHNEISEEESENKLL